MHMRGVEAGGGGAHARCCERSGDGYTVKGLPVVRHAQQHKHGEDRQNTRRYILFCNIYLCFIAFIVFCVLILVFRNGFVEELAELG